MRVSFLVYAVLYVVIEIIGYQLERIGWPELTPLDVATAVTNAMLAVAVLVAALVGLDLLGHRWRRWVRAHREEQARLAQELWAAAQQPIVARSWRPARWALPAAGPALPWTPTDHAETASPRSPVNAYAPAAGSRHAFPEDDGRLL
ncbi:hypothetical protein [Modestobacter roseus]|uniref:Uncharacterized protein n=1 Tax=Modestobacter roseus TaxID=1181884 RepID=A0A562IR18_9ACTN|nr:hypothetical protein [Modestobacter roseus]MQA32018.1 hypothetical protein [Modestobacter roseus]TWH73451.1 hypothetical protein JD78_01974 [Modestobacter roseus]